MGGWKLFTLDEYQRKQQTCITKAAPTTRTVTNVLSVHREHTRTPRGLHQRTPRGVLKGKGARNSKGASNNQSKKIHMPRGLPKVFFLVAQFFFGEEGHAHGTGRDQRILRYLKQFVACRLCNCKLPNRMYESALSDDGDSPKTPKSPSLAVRANANKRLLTACIPSCHSQPWHTLDKTSRMR